MEKVNVFLGGTCGNNEWRKRVMPVLDKAGITYFDPVVPNWTPECQEKEDRAKATADLQVYYLGNPMQPGRPEVSPYSIFELAKAPADRLMAVVAVNEWDDPHVQKAMQKIYQDIRKEGVLVFETVTELAYALVGYFRDSRA